jgi:WD40 repeat protein
LIKPIRENNAEWFKTNLSPLQQQAELWRRADYPDSLLLRDAALDEAVQWAGEHDADLMPDERKLLKLSLEVREQEQERARLVQQQLEAARQLAEAERQRAEEQAQAAQRLRARNRVVASLGIAALVLAAVAAIGFIIALNQTRVAQQNQQAADLAKATAEAETIRANTASDKLREQLEEEQRRAAAEQLKADSVQLANYATRATQPDLALLLSLEAMQVTNTMEAKTSLLNGLMRNSHLITFLHGPTSEVNSVAFSPDGKAVAAAGRDGLHVWDVTAGTPISQSVRTRDITGIAFSPDGRQLAVKDDSGRMTLWNWPTGITQTLARPAADLGQTLDSGNLIVFSPDGRLLATSGNDYGSNRSAIFVWDIASGQLLSPTLTFSTTYASRLAFDADSQLLAAGYSGGEIVLWDLASRQPLSPTLSMGTSPVTSLKFTQSDISLGSWLVAVDKQGRIAEIYRDNDSDTWRMIYQTETDLNNTNASINSPTFPYNIAFLNEDNMQITLRVGDTSYPGESLSGHTRRVTSSAFSPDGSQLVTADGTGRVILWRTSGTALSSPLPQRHTRPVIGAAYSRDGSTLVSVDDGQIVIWNTAGQNPTVTKVISLEASSLKTAMALSPDGKRLALAKDTGAVSVWDLNRRQQITEVFSHTESVNGLAFNPNGREFVSISADGTLIRWDAANGRPLNPPKSRTTGRESERISPSAAAFDPAGTRLVVGYDDGSIALLESTSLASLSDYSQLHKEPISKIAFDSTGDFATGSKSTIKLWSSALLTPTVIGTLPRGDSSTSDLTSLVFSPDGKLLLEGASNGAIALWDVVDFAHPRPVTAFPGHTATVNALTFSPDGNVLVSGGYDSLFQLWPMRPADWETAACRVAARNLSWDEWDSYFPSDQRYRATCPDSPVDSGEIVAGYLERAKRARADGKLDQLAQWLQGAIELSSQSQDFNATRPICEFALEYKMADASQQSCQRAVDLSLQANSYDQTASICRLGISNDLRDLVWPACTRAGELSAKSDDYYQVFSFCELGTLNDWGTGVLPACTRAAELSLQSDDPYLMFDVCALGSFFNLKVEFKTACQGAAKLGPGQASEAYLYTLAGDLERAKSLFAEAERQTRSSDDVISNNEVCWRGGLTGSAEIARIVLPACERAVEASAIEERGPYIDSRGLVRALLGQTSQAVEDFQSMVEWLDTPDAASQFFPETRARYKEERLSFIEALKAGQNPFDGKTLYQIRHE